MGVVKPERFDVCLISLDPTHGAEIKKTRPYVIISPDEINRPLKTIIVAPMTTNLKDYPTRIYVKFQGKEGEIVLDQIRTVDKSRIIKKLGRINEKTSRELLEVLSQIFR
jgi:mRNA interferase MazF